MSYTMTDHGAAQSEFLRRLPAQPHDQQRHAWERRLQDEHLSARARLMRPTLESIAKASPASGSAGYLDQNPTLGK